MNKEYLYKQTRKYYNNEDFESTSKPSIVIIHDGIVLPAKKDKQLPWGRGGGY